jgi:cyanophycin synthetase
VWVGDALVSDQNLSGCPGGRILLTDPAVEAAVIEMPRKGLIRFGHPCDRYDVAALLNVQDDHIGSNGIESLNAMANLKAEVLARASQAIVVNAEDLRCLAMREQAGTRRHILVAQNAETPALQQHLAEGGAGVFAQLVNDTPWIILAEGTTQTELMPLAEIPATMNGLLPFNESNALFATALAWAQDIALDTIRQALTGFANTPSQNPGRYNFINGYPFQLLLDFAHNPEGIEGLCAVVARIPVKGKRRLVCLNLGNRIASHLSHCTPLLARNFDSFVLGQDADRIAQSTDWSGDDPCDTMLKYFHNSLHEAGVSDDRMLLEPDKAKAIRAGLAMSEAGDLLVLMAEPGLALPIVG